MQESNSSKVGNPCTRYYQVSQGHPPYAPRARFLGELRGSWYDIGHQIGTKAGDLVRWVSDVWWKEHIEKWGLDDTMQAMPLYESQIAALSSDLIKFMQGIADGAAEELEKSPYAQASSHYHKVLNTNIFDAWSWRHPTALPWKNGGISQGHTPTANGSLLQLKLTMVVTNSFVFMTKYPTQLQTTTIATTVLMRTTNGRMCR